MLPRRKDNKNKRESGTRVANLCIYIFYVWSSFFILILHHHHHHLDSLKQLKPKYPKSLSPEATAATTFPNAAVEDGADTYSAAVHISLQRLPPESCLHKLGKFTLYIPSTFFSYPKVYLHVTSLFCGVWNHFNHNLHTSRTISSTLKNMCKKTCHLTLTHLYVV